MLDPIDLLQTTVIPVLRSMPTLVATVGSASNIYPQVWSYPDDIRSLFSVLPEQRTPSIMAAYRSSSFAGTRGNGIEHVYSLFLKPTGNVGPMLVALRDGIPAIVRTAAGLVPGGGGKFKTAQIHHQCRIPIISGATLQTMMISESSFIDYHEATLLLAERGADI